MKFLTVMALIGAIVAQDAVEEAGEEPVAAEGDGAEEGDGDSEESPFKSNTYKSLYDLWTAEGNLIACPAKNEETGETPSCPTTDGDETECGTITIIQTEPAEVKDFKDVCIRKTACNSSNELADGKLE